MEKIETFELIQELKKRGYNTDLLFSVYDVESILDEVNDDRADDEQIVIEADQFKAILKRAIDSNIDNVTSIINEKIERIVNYYEN
jgi:hypothetical protein